MVNGRAFCVVKGYDLEEESSGLWYLGYLERFENSTVHSFGFKFLDDDDETEFVGEGASHGRLVRGKRDESFNGKWSVYCEEYEADGRTLRNKEYLCMEEEDENI
jgi:hypothetical protein